ncbi:MAG TPA: DNA polymerase I [Vicinamibacteria bacterium]|nr:DNA polymerase I [Vicinamibacteria bacterium]
MASVAKDAVFLIDGSAQFHRAYHAIRGLATSRGLPTNATYGFTTMLRKLLEDHDPRFVGISFDLEGKTFRHEEFAEYKAHRPRMDSELQVQIPYVRRVCEAFRLPILEVAGYEADDVIATLAKKAVSGGRKVVVVSGDKDLLQLVDGDVLVLNPGREGTGATLYDRARVEEKWGVPPERVVDVLALVGDAVDNVPGVPGIGEKGARDLVREFGPVEEVLAHAEAVKRASYREGLRAHREDALLSKRLVTLRTDAPIELDLELLERREPDRERAHALFGELEFVALAKEYAPERRAPAAGATVVRDAAQLRDALAAARRAERLALAVVVTEKEPMRASLAGLALAWEEDACYVPLLRGPFESGALDRREALEALRPLLEGEQPHKLSANAKRDRVVLARAGVALGRVGFDAGIAAYLLNPGKRSYSLEEIAVEFLGERGSPPLEPLGSQVPPAESLAPVACAEALTVLRASGPVRGRLEQEGLLPIFETMELPLAAVLADMEKIGVKVDTALLRAMSHDMERQIAALTGEIHALAGGEFNVNSPVQLREVLFDRLGLKSGKKTAKTREKSTAEDVLEELAASHELPRKILEYRGVQKLKSTYVDALPALVHPETGRIHASFNQTVAATGRISSSDPNLQNIPIRTSEGRRIREAFVAEPGHVLLSADYSQIELRVLAHLSKDRTLTETFRRGEDVHARTAREVFGALSAVPEDEQRRVAKMINYALLYGKTAFSLAQDIGVTKREAETFIETYFARYPGVKAYIDGLVEAARTTGTVRTLLGRLRRLPDLNARNFQVRMEAERQARNTPIQGSAADLIKKAMIDLHRELSSRRMAARLVLQIHDELLLEVPEAERDAALFVVKRVMEGALDLDVPLVVDARSGPNWAAAH